MARAVCFPSFVARVQLRDVQLTVERDEGGLRACHAIGPVKFVEAGWLEMQNVDQSHSYKNSPYRRQRCRQRSPVSKGRDFVLACGCWWPVGLPTLPNTR
jgi:hypothetical protein